MNIYRRKDKQNHKETRQTNENIVTQSVKRLVKQTAIHSSHSQAVKQTVTQSANYYFFDSNKQSD